MNPLRRILNLFSKPAPEEEEDIDLLDLLETEYGTEFYEHVLGTDDPTELLFLAYHPDVLVAYGVTLNDNINNPQNGSDLINRLLLHPNSNVRHSIIQSPLVPSIYITAHLERLNVDDPEDLADLASAIEREEFFLEHGRETEENVMEVIARARAKFTD